MFCSVICHGRSASFTSKIYIFFYFRQIDLTFSLMRSKKVIIFGSDNKDHLFHPRKAGSRDSGSNFKIPEGI